MSFIKIIFLSTSLSPCFELIKKSSIIVSFSVHYYMKGVTSLCCCLHCIMNILYFNKLYQCLFLCISLVASSFQRYEVTRPFLRWRQHQAMHYYTFLATLPIIWQDLKYSTREYLTLKHRLRLNEWPAKLFKANTISLQDQLLSQ